MVDFAFMRLSLFPVYYNERKYSIIYMGVCSPTCLSGTQHKLFEENSFSNDIFGNDDSDIRYRVAELCEYRDSDFT